MSSQSGQAGTAMGEADRERYAKIGYTAMMGVLRITRNVPNALIRPWEFVDTESQQGFIACAEAVIAAFVTGETARETGGGREEET